MSQQVQIPVTMELSAVGSVYRDACGEIHVPTTLLLWELSMPLTVSADMHFPHSEPIKLLQQPLLSGQGKFPMGKWMVEKGVFSSIQY